MLWGKQSASPAGISGKESMSLCKLADCDVDRESNAPIDGRASPENSVTAHDHAALLNHGRCRTADNAQRWFKRPYNL